MGLVRVGSGGGDSGELGRSCDFEWVRDISRACRETGVRFCYHQTGALLRRDGTVYRIPREKQQAQAQRAEKLLFSESV